MSGYLHFKDTGSFSLRQEVNSKLLEELFTAEVGKHIKSSSDTHVQTPQVSISGVVLLSPNTVEFEGPVP